MTVLVFAVLIPVGPGNRELDRLSDTLDSLFHWEKPEQIALVLVNDNNSVPRLNAVASGRNVEIVSVVTNPRGGRGQAWTDGLTVGVLCGMQWIASQVREFHFVLKLDTDSLIISQFAEKLITFFTNQPEIGLVGTCFRQPGSDDPTRAAQEWGRKVRKLRKPVTAWRSKRGWRPQIGFWGRSRRIRRLVASAVANGYSYGETCTGGAYALSERAMRRIYDQRGFDDPRLFLHRTIGEDVIIGLLTRSVGLGIADFNRRNEPFGVRWQGLCAPPDQLLHAGYSIIHSVKDTPEYTEQEIRAFFAAQRVSRMSASSS